MTVCDVFGEPYEILNQVQNDGMCIFGKPAGMLKQVHDGENGVSSVGSRVMNRDSGQNHARMTRKIVIPNLFRDLGF